MLQTERAQVLEVRQVRVQSETAVVRDVLPRRRRVVLSFWRGDHAHVLRFHFAMGLHSALRRLAAQVLYLLLEL